MLEDYIGINPKPLKCWRCGCRIYYGDGYKRDSYGIICEVCYDDMYYPYDDEEEEEE